MSMTDKQLLYSIQETAKLLRVSEETIRRLIGSKQLEARKVGRQWRIPKDAIERYVGRPL